MKRWIAAISVLVVLGGVGFASGAVYTVSVFGSGQPFINHNGQVIADPGAFSPLKFSSDSPAERGDAFDYNNLGQVVGEGVRYGYGENPHAMIWDNGTTTVPGTVSLWNYTTIMDLGSPSGYVFASGANAINNLGQAVGYSERGYGPGNVIATLWQDGKAYNLNNLVGEWVGGWTLCQAFYINDNGEIVAQGWDSSRPELRNYFTLTPTGEAFPDPGGDSDGGTVPEPSTLIVWSLLGSFALGLGWWRKRKLA